MLTVEQLTKIYGTQKAIDRISFQAAQGEVLGFLGPNGAGKSTTMKIATGYIKAQSGQVYVDGLDIRTHSLEARKIIGYLPENNPLYLDMYVAEYLEFVGSLYKIKGSALKQAIKNNIARTGLGPEQHKKIGALSKGYRQRVGLAAALIHDPKVLILDEPTTGLDPNQIQEIRQVIREVGREKTVVFSSHIMQEVEALCERVVIINKGHIVADGKLTDLRLAGENRQIVEVQFQYPADEQRLLALDEVAKVVSLPANKYQITAHKGQEARPAISKLAAQEDWILTGLSVQENNLEQLFKELTQA